MDAASKSRMENVTADLESYPCHVACAKHNDTYRQTLVKSRADAVSCRTFLFVILFLLYVVVTSFQIYFTRMEVFDLKMTIEKMETKRSDDTAEQARLKRSTFMQDSALLLNLCPHCPTDTPSTTARNSRNTNRSTPRSRSRAHKRCVDGCDEELGPPRRQQLAAEAIEVEVLTPLDEEESAGSGDYATNNKLQSIVHEDSSSMRSFSASSLTASTEPVLGSTFVRWGKTTCPQLSTTIYSGHAAGAYSLTGYGGSSDLECLPQSPTWNPEASSNHLTRTLLTTAKFFLGAHTNVFPAAADNSAIPCAVCYTEHVVLQIPGWKHCPDGWVREYYGYLMSSPGSTDQNYLSSKNYCVDISPGYYQGHNETHGPKLTFVQAGHCGDDNLCGDYRQQNLLSCSVCSKSG